MGDPVFAVRAGLRLVVRHHGGAGRRRLEHAPDGIGGWIGHLSAPSRPPLQVTNPPPPKQQLSTPLLSKRNILVPMKKNVEEAN